MTYGAVSVSYYHHDSFLAPQGAYYYNGAYEANHAVALIGWDDAYPARNFRPERRPPSDGAFLVKNSWGAGSFTNGYTWISYCDTCFAAVACTAYPAPQPTNEFGRVYQYDPCGQVGEYNVLDSGEEFAGEPTNWCANVFTAVADGSVAAVGFHALSPGTAYELRVYADCGYGPSSGTLVASRSGTVENAGFATVRLEEPVDVVAKSRFAVALRLTCPGTEYPLPVE